VTITLDKAGNGVAVITISRPERLNALDAEAYSALSQAWAEVRDDDDVATAVITGGRPGVLRRRRLEDLHPRPASTERAMAHPNRHAAQPRNGNLETGHRRRQRLLPRWRADVATRN
jgi:enoyl-CoA hydratase/carnithine racemase